MTSMGKLTNSERISLVGRSALTNRLVLVGTAVGVLAARVDAHVHALLLHAGLVVAALAVTFTLRPGESSN